jgi:hypothetical protein
MRGVEINRWGMYGNGGIIENKGGEKMLEKRRERGGGGTGQTSVVG